MGWILALFKDRTGRCMHNSDERKLREELVWLREEHRALDVAIGEAEDAGPSDQLQMRRLKKKKLQLKDQISKLEDQLFPDIIA
jgi:hypothetical protein